MLNSKFSAMISDLTYPCKRTRTENIIEREILMSFADEKQTKNGTG